MLKTKNLLSHIAPQYIIDKAGKKTGVILDILVFEQLIEEIEDIYFGAIAHEALSREEKCVPHEEIRKEIMD